MTSSTFLTTTGSGARSAESVKKMAKVAGFLLHRYIMMILFYIFLSTHGMPLLQTIFIIFVVHHFHPTNVMICESDPKEAAKNKEKALEAANSELAAAKVRTPPGGRKAGGGRPSSPHRYSVLCSHQRWCSVFTSSGTPCSPVVVLHAYQWWYSVLTSGGTPCSPVVVCSHQ